MNLPSSFGPYEVHSPLGRGGMGEVYLAEDLRLRRKVAIKVISPGHAVDPARKARFLAEARAASALHHPNIVTVFDIGTEGQTDFIVMEYVEGRTLRGVLERRRPELREALEIGAQVASGLAAAHACGIVHRDIKPENIMIGESGTVKILDYGLAKLFESSADTPTAEMRALTAPGALVGTLSYMSPEQVESQLVDHRSDLFSLGIVLCEMISGRNPFASASVSETLQRITHSPPVIESSAHPLAPRVAGVVRRLLAVKPGDRYQCARDLELDLRAIAAPEEPLPAQQQRRPSWRKRALFTLGVLAAMVTAAAALFFARPQGSATPRISFSALTKDPGYEGEPTFSPDGQTIAYVSDRTGNFEIFLKQIAGGPDINLTNDPGDDVQPAFSPDGKQIAFVSTRTSTLPLMYRNPTIEPAGGDIWVMPALGGAPKRIVEDGNFPSWSPDGQALAFVRGPWSGQKIHRASVASGAEELVPVTMDPQPLFVTTPRFSPDGRWLAFSTHQPSHILVVPARGGQSTVVVEGRQPAWLPNSRGIVYSDLAPGRAATLSLVHIDGAGRRAGSIVPITSGRGEDRNPIVSHDGRTVLFASQSVSFNIERVPFDATTGKLAGPPEPITRGGDFAPFFSMSPDDRAVVFQSQRGSGQTLWRQEIGTGTLTQLSADDGATYGQPDWSPDGTQIAFSRTVSGGPPEAWVMRSDGGNARKVMQSGGFVSFFPDNRSLAFYDSGPRVVKLLDFSTRAVRVIATEGTIRTLHKFSADGKWMVYQAIGGRGVTVVRAVAVGNTKSRLIVESANENAHPFFSNDGRWVYFQRNHKNLFRVPGPAQGWKNAAPQQVTFFPESNLYLEQPVLGRNGRYLYYSRRSATSDLWSARFEESASR